MSGEQSHATIYTWETVKDALTQAFLPFRDSSNNPIVPSLQQVVGGWNTKHANHKWGENGPGNEGTSTPVRAFADTADGLSERDRKILSKFEKDARSTLMEATITGLVQKALLSALFLTFNIPSMLNPPIPFDPYDLSFIAFFLSSMLAIACGIYSILSGTLIASHAKAASITFKMAMTFSDIMAPHIIINYFVFVNQGVFTTIQILAVVYSNNHNHWTMWVGVSFCALAGIMVVVTKTVVNEAWSEALKDMGDIDEGESIHMAAT